MLIPDFATRELLLVATFTDTYCRRVQQRCLVHQNGNSLHLEEQGQFPVHHGDYFKIVVLPDIWCADSTAVLLEIAYHDELSAIRPFPLQHRDAEAEEPDQTNLMQAQLQPIHVEDCGRLWKMILISFTRHPQKMKLIRCLQRPRVSPSKGGHGRKRCQTFSSTASTRVLGLRLIRNPLGPCVSPVPNKWQYLLQSLKHAAGQKSSCGLSMPIQSSARRHARFSIAWPSTALFAASLG